MLRADQQGNTVRRAGRGGRIALAAAALTGALAVPGTAQALLPVDAPGPIDPVPIFHPPFDPCEFVACSGPIRTVTVSTAGAGTVVATQPGELKFPLSPVLVSPIVQGPGGGFSIGDPVVNPVIHASASRLGVRLFGASQSCTSPITGAVCTFSYEGKPGDSPSVLDDIHVDLSATAKPGWRFDGFGASTGPQSQSFAMTSDRTFYAHFTDLPPTVALQGPADGAAAAGAVDLTASSPDETLTTLRTRITPHAGGAPVLDQTTTDGTQPIHFDTTTVPDGAYDVVSVASDQASGQPATLARSLVVDNTPPDVAFTGGPAEGQTFGPGSTQAWSFKASDATSGVAAVACGVDAGPLSPCTGADGEVLKGLAGGTHRLLVRVTDRAGLARDLVRTFAIDATPPRTTFASGPADGAETKSTDPRTWTFAASEPGVHFACRLYPAAVTPPAFGDCTAPASQTANGLPAGSYVLEVRSTDAVGNVEAAPARRTFTVTGSGGNTLSEGAGKVSMSYGYTFKAQGRKTWFTAFKLSNLAGATKVTATCKGSGCPKKLTVKRSRKGKVTVPALVGRRLGVGATVTLRAVSGALTGRVVTLRITAPGKISRTERCLPGGKGKPQRCSG